MSSVGTFVNPARNNFSDDDSLPGVPLFGLTWTIEKSFGGMTNVFLHRSKAISDVAGREVQLLTLAPGLEIGEVEADLRSRALLGRNVSLRNLWVELGSMDDNDLAAFASRSQGVDVEPRVRLIPEAGQREVSRTSGKDVLQVDRYRPDGSLLLTDERDAKTFGVKGGRRVTIFDSIGNAIGQWKTISSMYHSWIDLATGDREAALIVDSQFCAGLMASYRSPDVVVAGVVHSTHMAPGSEDPFGPLSGGKMGYIRAFDNFDIVAVLTHRQAEEIESAELIDRCLRVIPNSRKSETRVLPSTSERDDFLIVSRLVEPKRIDHAVRALKLVHESGLTPTMRIVGDGSARPGLEALVKELGLSDAVEFLGFDPNASARFADFKFSLLTSQNEGMGLTLVESQNAGCLPIAYNIRYGPSDIIEDGKTGFLVYPDDPGALASTMERALRLDEQSLRQMSAEAVESAKQFSDEAIVKQWGRALSEALELKRRGTVASVSVKDVRVWAQNSGIGVSALIFGTLDESISAYISWMGDGVYGRHRGEVELLEPGLARVSAIIPSERAAHQVGSAVVHLDVVSDRTFQRIEVKPQSDWAGGTTERLELLPGKAGRRVMIHVEEPGK